MGVSIRSGSRCRRLRLRACSFRVFAELANAFFQGGKRPRVACGSQAGDVRLGEALVLAAERVGEWDVLDLAPAELGDDEPGDLIEAAAGAGADVEDALRRWPFGKEEVHGDGVAHEDKVPALFAGG